MTVENTLLGRDLHDTVGTRSQVHMAVCTDLAIGQADAAHGGAGARMASQARASARASAETVVPVAVAVEVMERL